MSLDRGEVPHSAIPRGNILFGNFWHSRMPSRSSAENNLAMAIIASMARNGRCSRKRFLLIGPLLRRKEQRSAIVVYALHGMFKRTLYLQARALTRDDYSS